MEKDKITEQVRQQKIAEVRHLYRFQRETLRTIQEQMKKARSSGEGADPNWARKEARVQLSQTLLDVMEQCGDMDRLDTLSIEKLDELKKTIKDAGIVDLPTAFLDMAQASTSKQ